MLEIGANANKDHIDHLTYIWLLDNIVLNELINNLLINYKAINDTRDKCYGNINHYRLRKK